MDHFVVPRRGGQWRARGLLTRAALAVGVVLASGGGVCAQQSGCYGYYVNSNGGGVYGANSNGTAYSNGNGGGVYGAPTLPVAYGNGGGAYLGNGFAPRQFAAPAFFEGEPRFAILLLKLGGRLQVVEVPLSRRFPGPYGFANGGGLNPPPFIFEERRLPFAPSAAYSNGYGGNGFSRPAPYGYAGPVVCGPGG